MFFGREALGLQGLFGASVCVAYIRVALAIGGVRAAPRRGFGGFREFSLDDLEK
jgi:hypothetical protein